VNRGKVLAEVTQPTSQTFVGRNGGANVQCKAAVPNG